MPGALNGATVAITGAAGFLGARLVDRLAREHCRILRIARSPLPPIDERPAATVIDIRGDVGERELWDRVVDADIIFHFAAQTSVAAAAADPDADFRANVTPLRHLLAACRDHGRRPIVLFAGTVTQAGIPSRLPVDEHCTDDPITVYDRHKLMAENDLKAAAAAGTLRGATLRLANVYGPGAHGRRADRDVLNRMIGAAVRGQPLTLFGTGEYLRDYIFVEDGVSIREAFTLIAERVESITGRPVAVTAMEPAAPLSRIERRHFVGDHSRFSAVTGWRPRWSLAAGIDRTIEALTCA